MPLSIGKRGWSRNKPQTGVRLQPTWRRPSHFLPLNEWGGLVFRDLGKPALNGSATGTPTWITTPRGRGINVTGGQAVVIPDDGTNWNAGDYTLRVLFYPTTWTGGFTALIDKATGSREFSVFFDTSGNISFTQFGTTTGGTATLGLSAGQVWDFVLTRTGNNATDTTAYVNGVNKASFSSGGDRTGVSGSNANFGTNPSGGGTTFTGAYLLLEFYPFALTAAEIQSKFLRTYSVLQARRLFSVNAPAAGVVFPWHQNLDPSPGRRAVVSY